MRAIRLHVVSLLLVPSLAAQTPAPAAPRAPLPALRSLSLDLAAATQHRARVALEPLVFGRWSVGVTGMFTDRIEASGYYGGPVPLAEAGVIPNRDPSAPCPPNCYYYATDPDYKAWSVDLAARYYPAFLTVNTPTARLMAYIGEFVGVQGRRYTEPIYFRYRQPGPLSPDTLIPPPDSFPYPQPQPYTVSRALQDWEPGVELGVRLMPARSIVVDVGGWFKLVRLDDPLSRFRPGDLDARLVVAAGIGW